ncbi:MAG: macro domain-containing protein [Planctomycetia bacterium]|nr:macro domain-containing protein [Planctomycetia bacterium]
MNIVVKVGDVLDEAADVLISSANPQLNMSGGVNGAILLRGGESIQAELRSHLAQWGKPIVQPGTIVCTGPGPLAVKHILHAVAVDVFYGSSVELVERTIEAALERARQLDAISVTMPTLATGYGPLSAEQFAEALARAARADWSPIASLTVVVRTIKNAETVRSIIERCHNH